VLSTFELGIKGALEDTIEFGTATYPHTVNQQPQR